MKATKTDSKLSESPKSVVELALDVADRGQSTAVAVLQDARSELRSAIENGIELAEKLAAGSIRFARKLVAKVDEAGNDALVGAERALSGAVKTARESRKAHASELAAASAA